jgi:hypothetical protein
MLLKERHLRLVQRGAIAVYGTEGCRFEPYGVYFLFADSTHAAQDVPANCVEK